MFTKRKFSMTMRYFTLLERNMFINHPSNSLDTIVTSLQKTKGETHFIQGLMKYSKQKLSSTSGVP